MSGIEVLLDQGDRAAVAEQLRQHWLEGRTTAVVNPQERAQLEPLLMAPLPEGMGPALVLGSGGSTGGRRWCLQPLAHLQRAAVATAEWLGHWPGCRRYELLNCAPHQRSNAPGAR